MRACVCVCKCIYIWITLLHSRNEHNMINQLYFSKIKKISTSYLSVDKLRHEGLLWWLSGQESPHQCGRLELDPWSRKIPHAVQQLSPLAVTIVPVLQSLGTPTAEPTCHHCWSLVPLSLCSTTREATAGSLHSAMTSNSCLLREKPV